MMYDVCVIGGGPAGMFSAYYSSSRGLRTILLEGDAKLGGRMHYYLEEKLYDVPGAFGKYAKDYLAELHYQLQRSNADVKVNALAHAILETEDGLHIQLAEETISSKSIILATGNGYIVPKQLEMAPFSPDAYARIRYDIPRWNKESEHRIAIIGHTPTAIDWALQAKKRGKKVHVFTYKPLTLQPFLMDQLMNERIPTTPWSAVKQFDIANDRMTIDGTPYDTVYAHIGTRKEIIAMPRAITQHDNGLTNHPRILIAGDARHEVGKIKLLLGAMHDAMQAVNSAAQLINPEAHYQPIVSTHHPIFKEWDQ